MTDFITPEMWAKEAKFLPWAALNEFMVDSFRIAVVRRAMTSMQQVGGKHKATIQRIVRNKAAVPGFRNAGKAPLPLQIQPAAIVFIKESELVSAVLSVWAETVPDLRDGIQAFLAARNWPLLPADADRTLIPGWLMDWPENDDLQTLGDAYLEATYPNGDSPYTRDDACLMICWISLRLPVNLPEDDEEEGETDEAEEPAAE